MKENFLNWTQFQKTRDHTVVHIRMAFIYVLDMRICVDIRYLELLRMLVLLLLLCFLKIRFFNAHRKILFLHLDRNAEPIVQMCLVGFPQIYRLRISLCSSFRHTR